MIILTYRVARAAGYSVLGSLARASLSWIFPARAAENERRIKEIRMRFGRIQR
jgi:hypothetical protein